MWNRCRAFVFLLAAAGPFAYAQGTSPSAPAYDPVQTFAPLTLPDPVTAYRSSNGAPGPSYWQNEADYDLHPTIDAENKQLTATETITYTNNSPDRLTSLWLHVEQNIYRKDSRSRLAGGAVRMRRRTEPDAGGPPSSEGYGFDSVEIEAGKQRVKADYIISDTRMQIRLAEPLKPKGGQL